MDLKVMIEKLNGETAWRRWKRQMDLLLKHNGVSDIALGKRLRPEDPAEDAANRQVILKDISQFEKDDAMCQVLIVSALDDRHVELTATCQNGKEMWSKLICVYEQSSSQRLDRTMEAFFTAEKHSDEQLVQYIARLQLIFREVNEELVKHKASELPDLVLMSRIVSTLPSEFFEFKSVWESIDVNDRSVDLLIERIRLIEQRLSHKLTQEAALTAKISKNKGCEKYKPFNNENVKKKIIKCFICKGPHYASNCPNKHKEKSFKSQNNSMLCYVATETNSNFIADSGASQHMCYCREYFDTFVVFSEPIKVTVGNGEVIEAIGEGNIRVSVRIGQRREIKTLERVWYVPKLGRNLMSVSCSAKRGLTFKASKDKCVFLKGNDAQVFGHRRNGLYELEFNVIIPESKIQANNVCRSKSKNTLQEWHECLAHQDKRHVVQHLKRRGININKTDEFCESCVLGKQHRDSYRPRTVKPMEPGELVSGDVCGPMEELSIGGNRYCVVFKDYFTKYRRIFFIEKKSEVSDCLEIYLNECKTTGHIVKSFMSDGGTEFCNYKVRQMLHKRGIVMRTTMPYTPEENGSIEREMRTLVESARTMLIDKNLSKRLWAEAINTATHVINRTGPTSEGSTPYELWFKKGLAPIDHFRAFGTKCFVHLPKQKRKKWSAKSIPGILVGYCGERDGYRVYDGQKVIISRDVVFKPVMNKEAEDKELVDNGKEKSPNLSFSPKLTSSEFTRVNSNQYTDDVGSSDRGSEDCRPKRQRQPPTYLQDYVMIAEAGPDFKDVVNSPEWYHWQSAMNDEMESLKENDVYELVSLPTDKKAIGVKWIFTKKKNPERYKARLVAKGYAQIEGVDYFNTYSPVARFDTIRSVLNMAAQESMYLKQFDVKTAFLYSNLDEEIYVKQPDGYDDNSGKVWKLKRSLYGLKQSPMCWNKRLSQFIKSQGFNASKVDPCLFIREDNDGKKVFITIYVDDGLICGHNEEQVNELVLNLQNNFKIKVTVPEMYLGIEITKTDNGTFLSQRAYTEHILEKFRMADCNPVLTPTETFESKSEATPLSNRVPYREAVGSLLYLTNTRPDICYAVSIVAQHVNNPNTDNWTQVKRILRYLKGTKDYALHYKRGENILHCYSDADYAGDTEQRKSRSGFICKFAGGAISWFSKKQNCISLSTTEAEYVAASEAAKHIVWLKSLLDEINGSPIKATLYIDNAAALKLTKNPVMHGRTKHIDVRYHFVRENLERGVYNVEHVPGKYQLADYLTKGLVGSRLKELVKLSGLRAN